MEIKEWPICCESCQLTVAPYEEQVKEGTKTYHEPCHRKMARWKALREFFKLDRGQVFIKVVPHRKAR